MSGPLVSVVIVNWNARDYIAGCVSSVLQSSYRNVEIILVDNHSGDDSMEILRVALGPENLSRITLIENDHNYGAARALNQGARIARGAYIMFLATDTCLAPNCISEVVKVLERGEDIGAISAKLLMMQDHSIIDSVGEYLSQFGLLMQPHAGQETDCGQFDMPRVIFSVKGTALTVRRKAFNEAGMFPEDYFMFLEETDLCWRIWLRGYRIISAPAARIYHAFGISIRSHKRYSYIVKYYGCRNYISTLWKNYGTANFIMIIPLHCALWVALGFFFLCIGRGAEGRYVLKGVVWNLTHVRYLMRERRHVQRSRVLSDRVLMPHILRPVGLRYLLDLVSKW